RAIHVLRPLRQDGPPRSLRQLVHRRGLRAQDKRPRRLRQRPARPVRSRAARVHEARRARAHPHRRVRRGIAEPRQPHRARRRQGRIRHAARQNPPQLRPGRGRAVERQLRGGPSHRQGHRRQGSVVGARQHADHPPHGRHHHGHRRGQLGGQQLRAEPRAAEPLSRRAGHLPHGGRVESDQHDLCPVAARRRAARGEVGGGRALRSARASAFSLLALANLLWAGNWVIGRALRDAFEPVALNFWRWLIAALVLAPFALPELARARATLRRHAGLLGLLALAGVAVFQTLVYLGLKTTTAINAVLLNSSALLFVISVAGLALLAPAFALEALHAAPRWPSAREAAGVLYIGLAASVAAFICWNRGVAIVGANAAGFTLHLLPAFGTALAMLLL